MHDFSQLGKRLPLRVLVPLIVACALFMENLDATVLSTALPAIAKDLQVDPIQLKLALTSYLVTLAVFIPGVRVVCGSIWRTAHFSACHRYLRNWFGLLCIREFNRLAGSGSRITRSGGSDDGPGRTLSNSSNRTAF